MNFEINYLKIFYVVELLLYAPERPIVDYSVIFLWLMSVGTVFCASIWPKITASKASDDYQLSPKVLQISHCLFCFLNFLLPVLLKMVYANVLE